MGLKLKETAMAIGLMTATPALGIAPEGEEVADTQTGYEAKISDILYEGDFTVEVKGYLATEVVKNPENDVRAYLVITEYGTPEFQKVLLEYIALGNDVNRLENGQVWFALGCTGPENGLLSDVALTRISASTKTNPVSVTLDFSSELSFFPDGDCLSLADSVR